MPIFARKSLRLFSLLATVPLCSAGGAAFAQSSASLHGPADTSLALPDAPSSLAAIDSTGSNFVAANSSSTSFSSSREAGSVDFNGAGALLTDPIPAAAVQPVAKRYQTVILPGQSAPRLSVTNKMVASGLAAVGPAAISGWLISAGYAQATNGSPNFPQTGKGFGQRLGAAAARASSETIFGNGIIAAATHEDPRYYKMGAGHNVLARLVYAGTRPLITRTDGGHRTLNLWDLGGDLSGAALTPAYYPALNTSFNEVLKTFGGSVGGDALAFVVSEFFGNILQIGGHHSAN